MELILSLGMSIVLALSTTATGDNQIQPSLHSCYGCSDCGPYEPAKNNSGQIFKVTNDSFICLSVSPIKWDFQRDCGQNICHSAPDGYIVGNLENAVIKGHELFCLSLTVRNTSQGLPECTQMKVYARSKRRTGDKASQHERFKLKKDGSAVNFPDSTPGSSNNHESRGQRRDDKTAERTYSSPEPGPGNAINKLGSDKKSTKHAPDSESTSQGPNSDSTSQGPDSDSTIRGLDSHSTTHGPDNSNSTQRDNQNGRSKDSSTTTYAVIGGAAVCIVLLLTLVMILMRKVKRQRKQIEMTRDEIDEFMLGIAAEKARAKGINGLFILPYDTKLEIPKSHVTIRSTVLGSGAFGQVVKGVYEGNQVAIKMLKSNATSNGEYLRSLLGELKVMSYLGSHPNLVGLIGAITKNMKRGEVYLIFEYCSTGNAHKFVRDHRENFVDMLAVQVPSHPVGRQSTPRFDGPTSQAVSLTTKDLVRWAYEIASGMEYVSAQNVYHGDLAARNILLTENLTAKVGDFGLSKQLDMEKYNCYVQKKECPLPLKWMAIESLRDLTFSIQSDVWSYAVTLWELFTLGATPYPGVDWNFESWKLLREGKRLDRPEYASETVYSVLLNCWDADPKARPKFSQLKDSFCRELDALH